MVNTGQVQKPVTSMFTYTDLCNAVQRHRERVNGIMRQERDAGRQQAAFTMSVAQLRRDLEATGLDVSGLDWDCE